jgi:hypothetical protein
MKPDINDIARGVQDTLDKLLKDRLIPFRLTAYDVREDGPGEYIVAFHDSRLHSARFSLISGGSIDEAVRLVMRERTRMMTH